MMPIMPADCKRIVRPTPLERPLPGRINSVDSLESDTEPRRREANDMKKPEIAVIGSGSVDILLAGINHL